MIDINEMFEAQMNWSYSYGVFYISGRDVMVLFLGFLIGVILVNIFRIIEYSIEEKEKNK